MKKVLLVLSLLSVVVVQAADAEGFVVVPQRKKTVTFREPLEDHQLSLRERIQALKAKKITIKGKNGSKITQSIWQLQGTYNLVKALLEGGSCIAVNCEHNQIKAIQHYRPEGKQCLMVLAQKAYNERKKRQIMDLHKTNEYKNLCFIQEALGKRSVPFLG